MSSSSCFGCRGSCGSRSGCRRGHVFTPGPKIAPHLEGRPEASSCHHCTCLLLMMLKLTARLTSMFFRILMRFGRRIIKARPFGNASSSLRNFRTRLKKNVIQSVCFIFKQDFQMLNETCTMHNHIRLEILLSDIPDIFKKFDC